MARSHLSKRQLAERWGRSPRTLQNWRWRGFGPRWLQLGGRVAYRLEDIERFEAEHLHANTVAPLAIREAGHEG